MGIDTTPFWANLYLSKDEFDFMSGLINQFLSITPFLYPLKTCFQGVEKECIRNKWVKKDFAQVEEFHGTFQFIDDVCKLNDKSHTKKFTVRNWNYS